MHIAIPYGEQVLTATLDWGRYIDTLDIADTPPLADPAEILAQLLCNPIGQSSSFQNVVQPGESIAIIVSDSFRHTGVEQLLPTLIDTLLGSGVTEANIFFVFSTGSHRGPTPEEAQRILGTDIYARFKDRAYSHDPNDTENLVELGTTSAGTPVLINRRVVEADRVICTGAVVFHYFGGFGGGRKSIVPGVAGLETIAHNHARNLDPNEDTLNPAVQIGALAGNPVAEDMLEGTKFCAVDLLINTVLNRNGEIAGIFCGDLEAAHEAACAFARDQYAVTITEQADLVIASAGKAKNFIQSHKALFNAWQALKPGGVIIFIAPAPEGYGGNKFVQWLELGTRENIIRALRKNAEINGQTALSTLEKAKQAILVTEMDSAQVEALGAVKASSLEEALAIARTRLDNDDAAWYLMPSAAYTVPFLG